MIDIKWILLVAIAAYSVNSHSVEFGFYSSSKNVSTMPMLQSNVHVIQVPINAKKTDILNLVEYGERFDVKLIYRMPVFRRGSGEKYNANESFPESIENMAYQRIVELLSDGNKHLLSLDEENVPWGGRAEILVSLYERIKKRLDTVKVYQWYSSSKKNNAPGVGQWPLLDADGWVFDQYTQNSDVYKEYVKSIRDLNTDMVSILWLSPNWNPNLTRRTIDYDYWQSYGFINFKEKLRINLHNSIPTVFFSYFLDNSQNPDVWWEANHDYSECVSIFRDWLKNDLLKVLLNDDPISKIDDLKSFDCDL